MKYPDDRNDDVSNDLSVVTTTFKVKIQAIHVNSISLCGSVQCTHFELKSMTHKYNYTSNKRLLLLFNT